MSEPRGPGPSTIERCVGAWQRARAALEADGDLAADEAAILTALEADPAAIHPDELLRRIVRAIIFSEARRDEAKHMVALEQARQQRYAIRAEFLRDELLEVMFALERKSFAAPLATASIKLGPQSVVTTDEQGLEDKYVRTKREPKKTEIGEDLKAGKFVRGAVLSNPMPVIALTKPRLRGQPVDQEAAE